MTMTIYYTYSCDVTVREEIAPITASTTFITAIAGSNARTPTPIISRQRSVGGGGGKKVGVDDCSPTAKRFKLKPHGNRNDSVANRECALAT